MKKILLSFGIMFALTGQIFAESQPLLSANFVEVENGNIAENTLLASDEGGIFIEFSKDTKFINAEEKLNFSGEILPPQVIELDISKPRGLIEELVTFEMVSSSGFDVAFLDKYDRISRKNLFRERLLNPDGLSRSAWVKLIYLINDPLINTPKLWEWQGEADGWKRIGGNVSETGEEGARILSVILRRTGIYTIFDENPPPRHFADEYEVYPRREYTGPYLDEVYPETGSIDLGFADDYNFKEDENFAEFHSAGSPPAVNYGEAEIPSTDNSSDKQLIQDLKSKLATNPAKIKETPEIEQKINNLITLVGKKIETKSEIALLTNELNAVSSALTQVETAEERTNLEKTFLELQTKLYKVESEVPDEGEFLVLKKEVDDFFAGIPAETLSANTFEEIDVEIDRSPPEEDFYIPENAELTRSGGEKENISWAFPGFLLICFGLLGWGAWSTRGRKKSF